MKYLHAKSNCPYRTVTVVRFPTPVPVREVTPAVGRPVKYNY